MQLKDFLMVGMGGALGSMLRYGIGFLLKSVTSFPAGTFLVNIAGSFLIGLIAGLAANDPKFQQNWQLFLAVGLCGGFTTFSAISLEGIQMIQQQKFGFFLLYSLTTISLGLCLALIGHRISSA
jgi:CrcB protein